MAEVNKNKQTGESAPETKRNPGYNSVRRPRRPRKVTQEELMTEHIQPKDAAPQQANTFAPDPNIPLVENIQPKPPKSGGKGRARKAQEEAPAKETKARAPKKESSEKKAKAAGEKAPKGEKASKAEKKAKTPEKKAKAEKSEKTKPAKAAAKAAEKAAAAVQEAVGSLKGGRKGRSGSKTPLRIIPLGGLGEIGKNTTLYECGNDMFLVDAGMAFPDDDMPGVDLVLPDYTYLERNREKLRGIVLTHGHEDHIGGLPYLLKRLNVPVYGTRLTIGLVEGKLKEHGLLNKAKLQVVKPRDVVKMGCMAVEFIHVNHSIPDACAMAIHTPVGVVIQTGDFKVDYTPIEGGVIDLCRFGELGSQGVLALLSDSTNSESPGSTPSERVVGSSFDKLFKSAGGKRIIVATFASNVHRIQQVIDNAVKCGRKVAVSGRSMENVVAKSIELGYLKVDESILVDIDTLNRYTDDQLVIITTGSQGEPMSALTRMARSDHRKVRVTPNDFIIISARPIPGNEKTVGKVVNDLLKLGAEVIYEKMYDVHVSGHACQDEQRLLLSLTQPKFFMPVHGEFKHLRKHSDTAEGMGIPPENIFIQENGDVMELDGTTMKQVGTVPAGRVLVDGLGVGDVGSIVLRDRKHLAEDGLIVVVTTIDSASGQVVSGPDLVSRGFVYVRESEEMMKDAQDVVKWVLERCTDSGTRDWSTIKNRIKDELSDYLYNRTKRSPMILPIIQEV